MSAGRSLRFTRSAEKDLRRSEHFRLRVGDWRLILAELPAYARGRRFETRRAHCLFPASQPEVRRLTGEMFLLFLIGVPVLEVFVFIEVGRTIGWLLTVLLLIGTSVLGARLLPIQGRSAIERVSLAVSERRAPARAALDGALGFLGAVLLVVPGFVTDAIGALLLLPATRALARSWLSLHYAGRMMTFVATAGRFASGERGVAPADFDSTAVDDDLDQLDR